MEQLIKEVKIASINDVGAFTGYASVFGIPDSYGDIIAPTAFNDVIAKLAAEGKFPPIVWEHEKSEPIGEQILIIDDKGIQVEGLLWIDQLEFARKAHKLMKSTKYYMSFYGTFDAKHTDENGYRVIDHIDALYETSITAYPAQNAAEILAVKSDNRIITALEGWLDELKK